jgi:hypothetical protein
MTLQVILQVLLLTPQVRIPVPTLVTPRTLLRRTLAQIPVVTLLILQLL